MRRMFATSVLAGLAALSLSQGMTKVFDKSWGGALFDTFVDCVTDTSGNTYIGGIATPSAGNGVNRVFKYSASGGVVWSKDIPGSTGNSICNLSMLGSTLCVYGRTGATTVFLRLDTATGNTVWSTPNSAAGLGGRSSALTANHFAGIVALTGERRLVILNASTGAVVDERQLQPNNLGFPTVTAMPNGDFVAAFDQGGGVSIVRRVRAANGDTVWERSFTGEVRSEEIAVLTDNSVAIGVSGLVEAHVEILDGNSGATLRSDAAAPGELALFAGLGGSYFVQADDFNTRLIKRDRNGYLLGVVASQEFFDGASVDASGKLILGDERSNPQTNQFDLRIARELDGFASFFPLALPFSAIASSAAPSGTFLSVVGKTDPTQNDRQGVLFLFKQARSTQADFFAYRKGQVLTIGAPGFLANDSGWNGGQIGITTQTQNGTVVLNADRSFTYTPNVGFFGFDSFTYVVRTGPTFETQTVTLMPMNVSAVTTTGGVDSIVGGNTLVGRVNTGVVNPFHTLVVQLTENITGLAVTSSVQIPQGKDGADFNIITVPVATDQTGTISAKLDNVTTSKTFTVKRATPSALTLNPTSLVAGKSFTGKVDMNGKAPAGGYVVNITHSGTEITTPVSVTVPANATTVSFNATTTPRSTSVTHVVTATSGGVSKTANLTLNPGGLFAFTITPTTVQGGTSANGKVQTAGLAQAGGTVITLTKDGGNVSVPGTVTVPEGAQFKNFTMTTSAVTSSVTRTITATFGTVVKTATLTITP